MRNIVATGGWPSFFFLAPAGAPNGVAAPIPRPIPGATPTFFPDISTSGRGISTPLSGSYRKALKYAGDEPDILYEVANVLVKKGQLPEARVELEKALAIDGGTHNRGIFWRGSSPPRAIAKRPWPNTTVS